MGPPAPWATVSARPPAGGTVALGLVHDGGGVWATFDAVAGSVEVSSTGGGLPAVVHATAAWQPDGAVAVTVNGPIVVALQRQKGGAWTPLVSVELDGAATGYLDAGAGLRYAYATEAGPLTSVRAGLFGCAGVRDPHVVQDADGSPVVRDGRVQLTMTNAGLGPFRAAHWAVWAMELTPPYRLQEVAKLFTRRDGRILGDHAGQLVRDGDRWIVLVSSWGDFVHDGVHVRHVASGDDLLAGVHILDTERFPLPTEHSAWDPGLTRINGAWNVAFVESLQQAPRFIFRPALARTQPGAAYDSPLTLVGRDTRRQQTEGPIIQRLGDRWWLLASDGDERCYRVYDLAMREHGRLQAPYGTNIPHAMVIPHATGPGSPHLMVTFDGTAFAEAVLGYGTHGDALVLMSPPPRGGSAGQLLRRGDRR
ncbi:MAG: hypothetical protein ACYDAC_10050 [Candidatus Dormibacteria bacterium]